MMFVIPGKEMSRGWVVSQVLTENDLEEEAGRCHAEFLLEAGGSKVHSVRSGRRSKIINGTIVPRSHVHKTGSVMYMLTFFT